MTLNNNNSCSITRKAIVQSNHFNRKNFKNQWIMAILALPFGPQKTLKKIIQTCDG